MCGSAPGKGVNTDSEKCESPSASHKILGQHHPMKFFVTVSQWPACREEKAEHLSEAATQLLGLRV